MQDQAYTFKKTKKKSRTDLSFTELLEISMNLCFAELLEIK